MARRKSKRGRKAKKKIPMLTVAGAAAGGFYLYNAVKGSSPENRALALTQGITGYNYNTNSFNASATLPFWIPIIGGAVASKLASKVGLNKSLSLPWVKF